MKAIDLCKNTGNDLTPGAKLRYSGDISGNVMSHP